MSHNSLSANDIVIFISLPHSLSLSFIDMHNVMKNERFQAKEKEISLNI
jgi:hypothetical protein